MHFVGLFFSSVILSNCVVCFLVEVPYFLIQIKKLQTIACEKHYNTHTDMTAMFMWNSCTNIVIGDKPLNEQTINCVVILLLKFPVEV